jgi:putative ABC transport system permease protein
LHSLRQDLRYAFRVARQNPWSTIAALLALTVGTGSTAAMFTVINGSMLRPLPLRDPARLVRLFQTAPGKERTSVSMEDYVDWKRQLKSFDGMALFGEKEANLTRDGDPARINIIQCESSLLPLIGLEPVEGRNFTPEENQPGAGNEAILTEHFWKFRYGGQPVLGRTIFLNDVPYRVIGIVPDALGVISKADVAVPVIFDFNNIVNTRGFRYYRVIARLRPGVSLPAALAEMSALSQTLAERFPLQNSHVGATGMYLRDWMVHEIRPALLTLFGAVCSVLLIACGNIANLLLVKASARRREISVRIAVGASRWRIARQLLTESLLLSFAGSALGLTAAVFAVHAIVGREAEHLPRPGEIVLDWRVFLFTAAVAVLCSFIFGLAPAFNISRTRANDALKELSGRLTETRGQQRTKRVFLAVATAFATLLLIESVLLIRTFERLSGAKPGFQSHNLITMQLALPEVRYDAYKHPGIVGDFVERARYRIQAIPGVLNAGFTSTLPLLSQNFGGSIVVKGKTPPKSWWEPPHVLFTRVSPNYFKTMGIPLREGRDFNDHDDNNSQFVTIVNEAFVRRYLNDRDPIGVMIRPYLPVVLWFQIVGVVDNYRQYAMDETIAPEMFTCIIQQEETQLTLVARTLGNPLSFVAPIQRVIHQADPALPVYEPMTMEQIESREMGWRSFHTSVLAALAAIALLLAAIGIYAVAAYSVAVRTPEIGVRMALGAQRSHIVRMILRTGAAPAICGTLAGAIAALVLRHMLAALLYGVTATDLPTYAAVVTFLILISLAATYIPAVRASSIDPSHALRYQ